MPVVIIIIAAALIASAIRDTWKQLGTLLVGDFTGSGNFLTWLLAIGCVGVIGYVPTLERFSRVFLALIVVAIVVKQGTGLFAQFTAAVEGATPSAPVTPPGQTITAGSSSDSGGLLSNIPGLGNVNSAISTVTGPINNALGSVTGLKSALNGGF